VKDRPCVVILAVEDNQGIAIVTVAPITHTAPANVETAVEIPAATKRRLGLDDARSWIVVSEGNRFAWPGPDLRPITTGRFDYGFLPPSLYRQVRNRFAAFYAARRAPVVRR